MAPFIQYFEDEDWSKSIEDILNAENTLFKVIQTTEPDFGYTKNKIWLKIKIQNNTEAVEDWRLYVRENFLQNYEVYVQRETGDIEKLEAQYPESPFSARASAYPELVTPIKISTSERVTLVISYWSGGSSNASLSLETVESFSTLSLNRMSKIYASYGMMMILIVGALLAIAISRLSVFWAYFAYLAVTLLFLMHIDGTAFKYLWPNFPKFNSNASIVIGGAYILATYNFSRVFLRTKEYHPKTDKVLLGLMLITLCVGVGGYFANPQLTKQFFTLMLLIAIFAGIVAGIIAAFSRFREVRFYLFAWVFGILCALIVSMRHVLGFDIPQDVEFDSLRISVVVDAIMLGLGIADRYTQLMKSSQRAILDNLKNTERNLELSNRLNDVEEQYTLALEQSASRDQDMRNTVHDLRQPLHALRLNVHNLKRDGKKEPTSDQNIEETFSYLENLIANHLKGSNDNRALSQGAQAHIGFDDSDKAGLNVQSILRSIYEMFLPDASEKGLDFKFFESSHTAQIDPLVLMRIISNLVSNAIKYTNHGKILLGSRKTKDGLRIELHDTGIGMTRKEFELAQTRKVRLHNKQNTADGHGYGLAIARDLAIEHGLDLYLKPNRQNGTGIVLDIPNKR